MLLQNRVSLHLRVVFSLPVVGLIVAVAIIVYSYDVFVLRRLLFAADISWLSRAVLMLYALGQHALLWPFTASLLRTVFVHAGPIPDSFKTRFSVVERLVRQHLRAGGVPGTPATRIAPPPAPQLQPLSPPSVTTPTTYTADSSIAPPRGNSVVSRARALLSPMHFRRGYAAISTAVAHTFGVDEDDDDVDDVMMNGGGNRRGNGVRNGVEQAHARGGESQPESGHVTSTSERVSTDSFLASISNDRDRDRMMRAHAITWCYKCDALKPPRTHHCSICNVCVTKMDHHCPWMGNCVGFANYKAFVLMCTYGCGLALSAQCVWLPLVLGWWQPALVMREVYEVASNVVYERQLPPSPPAAMPAYAASSVNHFDVFTGPILYLVGFTCCVVFGTTLIMFVAMHAYIATHGLTTIEAHDMSFLPYSHGFVRNLQLVFGASPANWGAPAITDDVCAATREGTEWRSYIGGPVYADAVFALPVTLPPGLMNPTSTATAVVDTPLQPARMIGDV